MSAETLELVRRSYEVINSIGRTGDEFVDPQEIARELWEGVTPDFELHERPDLPDAKIYRGREDATEFWRKTQQLFAEIHWEPLEFTDLGHAVVVETRVVARGRKGDVPIEADETDVFWFREGMLARLQAFPTKAEALRAAEQAAT
jgi:ketosteroid isomerase-like protein